MTVREYAVLFPCEGEELVGVIAEPQLPGGKVGVVVVVGGPQYRVGSHRQFVLLSRQLAQLGVPCMRFDYRGMGDATGAQRDFEQVDADIQAAIDAFLRRVPTVERVVLWGLCDGASAACFYASKDERVAGLTLLNPWVRTEQGQASTYLRHYYLKRLLDPGFWRKLFSGGVSMGRSMGEVLGAAKTAASTSRRGALALPERMLEGLIRAGRPVCVILSGRDYVAREFERLAASEPWRRLLAAGVLVRIEAADHTFSSREWRDEVVQATFEWVRDHG